MTPSALLGAAARLVSRTSLGRSAAIAGSRGAAHLVAHGLSMRGGVGSVYLTGSLTRPRRFEPGHSDIDLVLACDFDSHGEAELSRHLREWQDRASVLGGLFYNLDCLDVREVPYARAFGGSWEMRLDAHGQLLAGRELFSGRVQRPAAEIRCEDLATAFRRWVNTGARLLDPTVSEAEVSAERDARRLFANLAELWSGIDVTDDASALRQQVESLGDLPSLTEALGLGLAACKGHLVRDVFLPATLEMLDAFGREVTADFGGKLGTSGDVQRLEPPAELSAVGASLLGAPFESVVLLGKGPRTSEYLLLGVASREASAREIVREAVRRFARSAEALQPLRRWCRRPVPLTRALWRALSLVEPAPFVGAAAAHPVWHMGTPLEAPPAPGADALAALINARVVQSFTLCRGPELRPRMPAENRRRALVARFALLGALDRAIETGEIDAGWLGFRRAEPPPSEERARLLQDFSARHRRRLAPLLATRFV